MGRGKRSYHVKSKGTIRRERAIIFKRNIQKYLDQQIKCPSPPSIMTNEEIEQQFDDSNDTKTRNRLSLSERVEAIKAYEKTPIYQKVGLMFNCSAKQIRNIVKNKHKVLALYAKGMGTARPNSPTFPTRANDDKRAKKIQLLGRIMYEWFLRARRNPDVGTISYKLLQSVALEVKQILNVENFTPNNAWLMNFRQNYNITDLFSKTTQSEDPGPISVDINEIVEHVQEIQRLEEEADMSYSWMGTGAGWNDSSMASSTLPFTNSVATTSSRASSSSLYNDDDEPRSKFPKLEPIGVIELDDTDDEDDATNTVKSKRRSMKITTLDQAVRHLKPLEDFALMKEDFRAIGLLSQLEMILRNAKKKKSSGF